MGSRAHLTAIVGFGFAARYRLWGANILRTRNNKNDPDPSSTRKVADQGR